MEAKLQEEINQLPVIQKVHIFEPTISAVAEISFKAGQEEESTQAYHAGLHDGILRGRREVMEWGNEPCPHYTSVNAVGVTLPKDFRYITRKECPKCWQVQKEKWGV